MTRNAFLKLVFKRKHDRCKSIVMPTSMEELNKFAELHNAYIEGLKNGIVSIKMWERAAAQWERMTS